jgi:TonB family protein
MNESAAQSAAGHKVQAETALKNAVREAEKPDGYKPGLVMSLVALADCYEQQGNHKLAEANYKRACELEKEDSEAYKKLAAAIKKQGRTREAAEAESLARQIDQRYSRVDFKPYMSALTKRIRSAWTPGASNSSTHAVATFVLDKIGNLHALCLMKSSASKEADQAALQAVADAAPFGALPTGSPEVVYVQYSFDFNVLSHPATD